MGESKQSVTEKRVARSNLLSDSAWRVLGFVSVLISAGTSTILKEKKEIMVRMATHNETIQRGNRQNLTACCQFCAHITSLTHSLAGFKVILANSCHASTLVPTDVIRKSRTTWGSISLVSGLGTATIAITVSSLLTIRLGNTLSRNRFKIILASTSAIYSIEEEGGNETVRFNEV